MGCKNTQILPLKQWILRGEDVSTHVQLSLIAQYKTRTKLDFSHVTISIRFNTKYSNNFKFHTEGSLSVKTSEKNM